jgi:hypothetical protein
MTRNRIVLTPEPAQSSSSLTDAMRFVKYHALGNDYLVIPPTEPSSRTETRTDPTHLPPQLRPGLGRHPARSAPKRGLRLQAAHLQPRRQRGRKKRERAAHFFAFPVGRGAGPGKPFTVETPGGAVTCQVGADGRMVTVGMGKVSFDGSKIPVRGEPGEVLRARMKIDDREFEYCAATVGNPHCIVLCDDPTPALARRYGPLIETDEYFPTARTSSSCRFSTGATSGSRFGSVAPGIRWPPAAAARPRRQPLINSACATRTSPSTCPGASWKFKYRRISRLACEGL